VLKFAEPARDQGIDRRASGGAEIARAAGCLFPTSFSWNSILELARTEPILRFQVSDKSERRFNFGA